MAIMVYHQGTGTLIDAGESSIVEVPDNVEDAEDWVQQNKPTLVPLTDFLNR
jgi:hypothetical protein